MQSISPATGQVIAEVLQGNKQICPVTFVLFLIFDFLQAILSIIMITILVGILRHYVSIIISSQKKIELQQVQDR